MEIKFYLILFPNIFSSEFNFLLWKFASNWKNVVTHGKINQKKKLKIIFFCFFKRENICFHLLFIFDRINIDFTIKGNINYHEANLTLGKLNFVAIHINTQQNIISMLYLDPIQVHFCPSCAELFCENVM